ncbi:MAG: 5-formyltetrahydrofolate cyclo-ligase [Gammaproteobacteria bacterium]
MPDHRALRQTLRARRRSIPPAEASHCARQLARNIRSERLILNSRRIAAYLAADGELDPYPLIEHLWSLGKQVYLPVLVPFTRNRLWFARFEADTRLATNRFGIPEPAQAELIRPAALDLVLTPLVAFDRAGHRIGMGGGFYDRSFAFLLGRRYWRKPALLGIAYAFQQQPTIIPERWDVPLDAIATESGLHRISP